ncbi:MAG TPA: DMT family transporter [Bryobacteraceae bacterium]|nr:DMT family transporter [Bryobacteraceae bacterium]
MRVGRASWMLLSIATVLLWGSWGLESKIIVDRISPWMNQALFSIGLLPLMLWIFFWKNLRQVSGSARAGAAYALLTGVLGGVGNITLYLALARGGNASVVVPLAGLAPLVTVVLAFMLLREKLNRLQGMGVILALVSIYLLSV